VFKILPEICNGCAECLEICTFGAIAIKNGQCSIDQEACGMCGSCEDICLPGAIVKEFELGPSATDIDAYSDIWVVCEAPEGEIPSWAGELLSKARELATKAGEKLVAVVVGCSSGDKPAELTGFGADKVLVVDDPRLGKFCDDVYANVIAYMAKKELPSVILAASTARGRAYIPRVATMLETGLTADCMDLDIASDDNKTLLQTRPTFGGNLIATITCKKHRPQMATVRPHVFKALERDPARSGDVVNFSVPEELLASRAQVVETHVEPHEGPDITEAEVVVTVGRGIGDQKTLEQAKELADLLGGALGATRPITDEGWLPDRAQIGQTGVTIAPKLYVGLGVSGAVHHTVGIRGSEIIVAINKDPEAPIFEMATYGIVGDVHEILPLLIERIKQEKG